MRESIERKTKEHHLIKAAELAAHHKLKQLKVYMMLGLPGRDRRRHRRAGALRTELSRIAPRVALGIAPFVAKRNTPLDGTPFGRSTWSTRSSRACAPRSGAASSCARRRRWAWVEYVLAQGGLAAGRAAARAARAGGRFADWKAAFADVPAPAANDAQSPTVAIASISTRAPLGRPAA